jgi:multimeric flavodoxin WrbA
VIRRRLLIVWHSRTGAAEALARAAAEGAARETGVETILLAAEAAGPDDLISAQAFIFAAPENLAALSGEMKAFLDRSYYPALDQLAGRPYAAIIAAGSDGAGAARQLARIATGWRLKPVAEPLIIITDAQTPEAILARKHLPPDPIARAADLGQTLAAGLAMGVF